MRVCRRLAVNTQWNWYTLTHYSKTYRVCCGTLPAHPHLTQGCPSGGYQYPRHPRDGHSRRSLWLQNPPPNRQRLCRKGNHWPPLITVTDHCELSPGPDLLPSRTTFTFSREGREVYYNFSCASPPMPPHTLAFLSFGGPLRTVLFQNSRLYTSCLSKLPRFVNPEKCKMGCCKKQSEL